MRAIFDPQTSSYTVRDGCSPVKLGESTSWPTRQALADAAESVGLTLNPNLTLSGRVPNSPVQVTDRTCAQAG